MSLDTILAHLPNARQIAPNRWRSPCPLCGGSRRATKLAVARDLLTGDSKIHCHACGANGAAVVAALGLKESELFANPVRRSRGKTAARLTFSADDALRLIDFEIDTAARMVLVTPTIADLTPDQRCRLRNAGISAQASIATVAVPENHMLWMVARHVEPAARVILSAAAGNEIDREDRAELAYMAREIRVAREFEGLREVEA